MGLQLFLERGRISVVLFPIAKKNNVGVVSKCSAEETGLRIVEKTCKICIL